MVIPAAGRARRFGLPTNKIWAEIAGQSVLERTLTVFCRHPAVSQIVIVSGADEIPSIRALSSQVTSRFPKEVVVVPGGDTRADSVRNGLEALSDETEIVLVHDAARPLLAPELIDRIIAAVVRTGAAVPGLPLSDTVKRVNSSGIVRATIPRSATVDSETLEGLTAVQTPQGAILARLRDAYARYDFARSQPTDEASLIEATGGQVEVVPGEPNNIKITRQEDIPLAERLIQEARQDVALNPIKNRKSKIENSEFRTGFGYDIHAFAAPEAGRKLFLGGVEIPHDRGLEGHSDADVLLHAVCDALLGAASLGDIGILFPNTDPAFKGISSLRLLEICAQKLEEAGWQVVNIDATVVAEAPKLMPHRAAIMRAIAGCLGIEPDRVSVKATTSEKLGAIGRREGIAAWAVATARK